MPIYNNISSNIYYEGRGDLLMFVYKKKLIYEGEYNASIIYEWDIVIRDKAIGNITLEISQEVETEPLWSGFTIHASHMADLVYRPRIRMKTNAYATIHYNSDYSHIMQLMKDFKQMANNKLLDIDEDYEPLRFIEVNHSYDALRVEFY